MLTAAPFFLDACASTFVAYKDGHGYYVGSGSDSAYRLFCDSGDFKKIAELSYLHGEPSFYQYYLSTL